MAQSDNPFTPERVDEQIDDFSQDATTQRLTRRLRQHYATHDDEQGTQSLQRAWDRITGTDAYAAQAHSPSAGQRGMPGHQEDPTTRPRQRILRQEQTNAPYLTEGRQRFRMLTQALVAVLIIGVVLGGVTVLFLSHRHAGGPGPTGHSTPTALVPGSIVVTVSQEGVIYGIRPSDGAILWTYATQEGTPPPPIRSTHNLLVDGPVVYFAQGGLVVALQAASGNVIWKQHLILHTLPVNGAQLALDDGKLYVGGLWDINAATPGGPSSGRMAVFALQAANGSILWSYQTTGVSIIFPVLAVNNGVVYVRNADADAGESVEALQGQTGKVLWSTIFSYRVPFAATATSDTLYVVVEGRGGSRPLLALDAQHGRQQWGQELNGPGANLLDVDFPVLAQGMLIVGIYELQGGYRFCAYRVSDGAQTWCSADEPAGRSMNETDYVSMGSSLYAAAVTGATPASLSLVVESLAISTGSHLWSMTLPGTGSPFMSVMGSTVYAAAGATLYALDSATGQQTWTLKGLPGTTALETIAAGSW